MQARLRTTLQNSRLEVADCTLSVDGLEAHLQGNIILRLPLAWSALDLQLTTRTTGTPPSTLVSLNSLLPAVPGSPGEHRATITGSAARQRYDRSCLLCAAGDLFCQCRAFGSKLPVAHRSDSTLSCPTPRLQIPDSRQRRRGPSPTEPQAAARRRDEHRQLRKCQAQPFSCRDPL